MDRKNTITLIVAVLLSAGIAALSAGYVGLKVGPIYDKNRRGCEPPRLTNLFFSIKEKSGFLKFHSETVQDRWIVLCVFPGITNGYFVDVGSGDGVQDSNTKALEELGWRGVCIDPFPTNMNDRTCTTFKEVVDSAAGRKLRFRTAGFFGGIENYLGNWKESGYVQQSKIVELTTTTLEDILRRAQAPNFIHYVSLDIEGGELEALKGFPFSKYKVGAFTIEHNYEEPKRSQIKALLESKGYRRALSVERDDFYILDSEIMRRNSSGL